MTQKAIETEKNHFSSPSACWDRYIMVCYVMTWRRDVTTSNKWIINNIFELIDPTNYGNKKRINFLGHIQAEIGKW